MKKPKYMQEMLKIIFSWLGIMFAGMGTLGFMGVMKPKESSMVQEPVLLGMIFFALGIVFVIVSIFLGVVTAKMDKRYSDLAVNGTRINGVVEKVYLQKSTQYGKQSPYRILYTYTYLGKAYHQKSCFMWEKPDLLAGDSIEVSVNDMGDSVILLK